ncbi:hypothetical protein KSP39_PZI015798 [Platanthera zijinensis]|uniref:Uncharacterized protein n=1 Tax=Platanthera zijinensis TaxID=2320716 RepID=A0AAP0B999_9ASPA
MEFLGVAVTLLLLISGGVVGLTSKSLKWTHINNPNFNREARMAGLAAMRSHNGVLLPGEVALTFCWVKEAKVKQYDNAVDEYILTIAVRAAAGTEGDERVAFANVMVLREFPDKAVRLKAFLYKPNVKPGKVPWNQPPPLDLCN